MASMIASQYTNAYTDKKAVLSQGEPRDAAVNYVSNFTTASYRRTCGFHGFLIGLCDLSGCLQTA